MGASNLNRVSYLPDVHPDDLDVFRQGTEKINDDLDLELNPKTQNTADVLAEQPVRKLHVVDASKDTLHDADFNRQPTDIEPLASNVIKGYFNKSVESSNIPANISEHIAQLATTDLGAKKLQEATSVSELESILDDMSSKKAFPPYQYQKIKKMLRGEGSVETVGVSESSERYKIPEKLTQLISKLAVKGSKRMKAMNFFLDTKPTKESVISFLEENKQEFEPKKFEEAMGYLDVSPDVETPAGSFVPDAEIEKKPEVKEAVSEVVVEETPKPESIESVENTELDEARHEYAVQKHAWEKKLKEKNRIYKKLISALGKDNDLPEQPEPKDLADAKKAYFGMLAERKAKKISELKSKIETPESIILGLEEDYRVSPELIDMTVQEHEKINSEEGTIKSQENSRLWELGKKVLSKGMEKYSKLGTKTKYAVSVSIIASTSYATVGAVGAYAGYRLGRSVVGGIAGRYVGKKMQESHDLKNADSRAETAEDYARNLSIENLEEKEVALMQALDKEKKIKNKQALKKAAAMFATGGAVTLGTGWALHELGVNFGHTPSGHGGNPENLSGSKPSVGNEIVRAEKNISVAPKVAVDLPPEVPENIQPVEVSLSSKGFIQDIHNLKEQIRGQYTGQDIPEALQKNILEKSDIDLAKQFHFFDPEHNLSAMGMAGDKLGIDEHGNMMLEHADGGKDLIINTSTGEVHAYEGKMFNPNGHEVLEADANSPENVDAPAEAPVDTPAETSTPAPSAPEAPVESDVSSTDTVPVSENPEVPVAENTDHIISHDGPIDLVQKNGARVVLYNHIQIAHTNPDGVLALDDKYMDGANYAEIRKAFIKTFEENTLATELGKTPMPIPFEDGKIYIIRGVEANPNYVKVWLNGKEIANGFLNKDGHPIELVNEKGIKGGFFLADTVYERAFKAIKKTLKTLEPINTIQ